MEKLQPIKKCIRKFKSITKVKKELYRVLDLLHEKGWKHNDIHLRNLMCKNGHFAFIDFGLSDTEKSIEDDKLYTGLLIENVISKKNNKIDL